MARTVTQLLWALFDNNFDHQPTCMFFERVYILAGGEWPLTAKQERVLRACERTYRTFPSDRCWSGADMTRADNIANWLKTERP